MNWDIKIPKTLRQFGYRIDKSDGLRRAALLRASAITGRNSVLFNLSSLVMITGNNDPNNSKKFNRDLDFFIRKIRTKI